MKKNFGFLMVLITLLLASSLQSAFAQEERSHYFPKTGHYVTGDFYDFYFANPNAQRLYGDPATEAFIDPKTGFLVQYFEKARFEYLAGNPPAARVQLSPLGQKLYEHGDYITGLTGATPGCQQSLNWDYPVCFAFLDFYQQFGGEAQFGQPVSGLEHLRGRLVQFFEKGELIWMPENDISAEIVVAQLGLTYFFAQETNLKYLEPIQNFEYHLNISDIDVTAFTKNAVISNGSTQVIDMIAVDQNHAPLNKGIIQVTLRYPDGRETNFNPMVTDKYGLASFAFTANTEQLGLVEVIVQLTYNNLEEISVTSFRIWY